MQTRFFVVRQIILHIPFQITRPDLITLMVDMPLALNVIHVVHVKHLDFSSPGNAK